ncbi:UNVERIFIED_CONTAM: hypothetical protein HDU68_005566 [Siphonaria sp. JEL0065]|nr:hypothetical protein HDU68_005566 [Siphonaria sp. JEL0065]
MEADISFLHGQSLSSISPTPPRHQTPQIPSMNSNANAAVDFEALKKDPKYKRYVNSIDSILKLFDSVNEWADVIGFLSKLLKVIYPTTLQLHSQYSNVPRKLVVSKRLAQCLNPALPSGVHQKTLEVYQAIFEAAGPAQLAEDLPLWSYGLFPFFQSSAMSVKPVVLQLYERHYLTLGLQLKPSLKGLILALLPGVEEEGNEFVDAVMRSLDKLCDSVGTVYFYHCLALAMISGQRLRGAALNYLLRRMLKFESKEEMTAILGADTLIVSRALASALEDKQMLVQRGALELLVVHFPLQNALFSEEEVEVIIRAAIGVVLRKDMSLNRRLYSWLLGSANQLQAGSRESLINTIRNMLWIYSEDIHELTKPYRIIISLLDKDEIGSVLLERILLDVFKSLKQRSESFANYKELLQSAEMLLDAINPFIIWKRMYHLVKTNPIGPCQNMQVYEMLGFMLEIIRFDDEEVRRIHLPILLYWLSFQLEVFKSTADFSENSAKLPLFLSICSRVLSKIPRESMTRAWNLKNLLSPLHSERLSMELVDSAKLSDLEGISVESFSSILYGTLAIEEGNAETGLEETNLLQSPYLSEFIVGRPVVQMGFLGFQQFLKNLVESLVVELGNADADGSNSAANKEAHSVVSLLEVTCGIVEKLACVSLETYAAKAGLQSRNSMSTQDIPSDQWDWFVVLSDCVFKTSHFSVLNVSLSCVVHILLQARQSGVSLKFDTDLFIQICVSRLWFYLDPAPFGIYHTRAVDLLWQLCSVTKYGAYIVENVVGNYLTSRDIAELVSHQQRFGILWRLSETKTKQTGITFSRPLFLVLDALRSQVPSIKRSGEAWLKTYVTSYSRVTEPILATLLHPDILVYSEMTEVGQHQENIYFYKREFNMGQVLYSVETLCLLLSGHRPLLQTLWTENVKEADFLDLKDLWLYLEFGTSIADCNYAEILIFICLRFLRTEIHPNVSTGSKLEKLQAINTSIQSQACEFISKFLGFSEIQSSMNAVVAKVLIRKISYSISVSELDLQPRLLLVLSALHENQEKLVLSQKNSHRRNSLTVGDALDNLIVSSREVLGLSPSASKLDEQIDSFAESFPGFLQMILASLTQTSNRLVLQHWADFVLLMLPRINLSFRSMLQPIVAAICDQISQREKEIGVYVQWCKENFRNNGRLGAPDKDVVILVSLLDRILEFCLESEVNWKKSVLEKNKSGSNLWDYNLTGIVTSVFVDATPLETSDQDPQNSRDAIIELMPGILGVLKSLFSLFKTDPLEVSDGVAPTYPISGASLHFLSDSVCTSLKHILESIYSKYPSHLIESALEVWFSDYLEYVEGKPFTPDFSVLTMIHLIRTCTSQVLVTTVVEGLRVRLMVVTNTASTKDRMNPFFVKSKQM